MVGGYNFVTVADGTVDTHGPPRRILREVSIPTCGKYVRGQGCVIHSMLGAPETNNYSKPERGKKRKEATQMEIHRARRGVFTAFDVTVKSEMKCCDEDYHPRIVH